jgi:hypothetical protein
MSVLCEDGSNIDGERTPLSAEGWTVRGEAQRSDMGIPPTIVRPLVSQYKTP